MMKKVTLVELTADQTVLAYVDGRLAGKIRRGSAFHVGASDLMQALGVALEMVTIDDDKDFTHHEDFAAVTAAIRARRRRHLEGLLLDAQRQLESLARQEEEEAGRDAGEKETP